MKRSPSSWRDVWTKLGFKRMPRRRSAGRHRLGAYSRRSRLEPLEDRRLLAGLERIDPGADDMSASAALFFPDPLDEDDDPEFAQAEWGDLGAKNFVRASAFEIQSPPLHEPFFSPWPRGQGTAAVAEGVVSVDQPLWGNDDNHMDGWSEADANAKFQYDDLDPLTADMFFGEFALGESWDWQVDADLLDWQAYLEGPTSGTRAVSHVTFTQKRGTETIYEFDAQLQVVWYGREFHPQPPYPPINQEYAHFWLDVTEEVNGQFYTITDTDGYLAEYHVDYTHKLWRTIQHGDELRFHSSSAVYGGITVNQGDGSAGYAELSGLTEGGDPLWQVGAAGAGYVIQNPVPWPPTPVAGPPQVIDVTISDSISPSHTPYSFCGDDNDNVGSGEQLRTVPVGGADTITIEFSEGVMVTEDDLTIIGLQTQNQPEVVDFSWTGTTATWTFAEALAADQYQITLNSDWVCDGEMNRLDGEWDPAPTSLGDQNTDTFPSGDGVEGGDFEFAFTVLPADFTRDNVVDRADYLVWNSNNGLSSGATHAQGDADGDGDVDIDDYEIWMTLYAQSIEPGLILVSTADDNDDENLDLGELSLREAIGLAADNLEDDTIVFLPSIDEILLDSQLAIGSGNDVEIRGPGANLLTIAADGTNRVFSVSGADVTISGLTITGGGGVTTGGGVASVYADLTLDLVRVTDNETTLNGGERGGGVYSWAGPLHIFDSTIDNNRSHWGGGLFFQAGDSGDVLEISGSSFYGNEAIVNQQSSGGAISVKGGASMTIVNSTVSGNEAYHSGGIRVSTYANLTVINSTITDNHATGADGGGIVTYASGNVEMHNSIVANNTATTGLPDLCNWASFDAGSSHNLIGNIGNSGLSSELNIVIGGGTNPGLASLGEYGGPTKMHALLGTSLAIDAGGNALALDAAGELLTCDQRGFERYVDVDGDGGDTVDIGAFEYAAPIVVSTAKDEDDAYYGAGRLSLREALDLAAAIPGNDTISFDPGIGSEILLDGEELVIDTDVAIVGPGATSLTIDAHGQSRVFRVDEETEVTISGLAITGGNVPADTGGGIKSLGDLTLSDVNVHHNLAALGGGITQLGEYGHSLTIVRSSITDNEATIGGGLWVVDYVDLDIEDSTIARNTAAYRAGLAIDFSDANIKNSTISSNTATQGAGGGIGIWFDWQPNEITLTNVTVANNEAATVGGGIYVEPDQYFPEYYVAGSVVLQNSIVAGNTGSAGADDVFGPFDSSSSYNLIGAIDSSVGLTDPSNKTGTRANPLSAGLTALGWYGGPTETHALLDDSPAIDAGDNDVALAYGLDDDQRGEGYDRIVDWDGDLDPVVDIGAFELALGETYGSA